MYIATYPKAHTTLTILSFILANNTHADLHKLYKLLNVDPDNTTDINRIKTQFYRLIHRINNL